MDALKGADKLKQMRLTVKDELNYIPKGNEAQNELRMLYFGERMHSLGKKAKEPTTKEKVLERCIGVVEERHPGFKPKCNPKKFAFPACTLEGEIYE